MNIYVCKMCGRAMACETKPLYCYADRTEEIVAVSYEEAHPMGLFRTTVGQHIHDKGGKDVIVEFFKDVKYWPFTGELCHEIAGLKFTKEDQSLNDFPNIITERARLFEGEGMG
jgi:hypothetical protein